MSSARRQVFLIDSRVAEFSRVPAWLLRDLEPDQLVAVEEKWGPIRAIVRESLDRIGQVLEHSHWDWRNKIERALQGQLLVSAIEFDGEIQGLIAVASRTRFASLTPGSRGIYVDYVEKAQWNISTPNSPPHFGGIGTILLADAVFRNQELGHGGRIGLHSLGSAESYYRNQLGMSDLGEDPAYYDLRYFEYTADMATSWLTETGAFE